MWLCKIDKWPPPHLWKRGSSKEEKAELLTFGKGPLASDWVMVSAASVKHLYYECLACLDASNYEECKTTVRGDRRGRLAVRLMPDLLSSHGCVGPTAAWQLVFIQTHHTVQMTLTLCCSVLLQDMHFWEFWLCLVSVDAVYQPTDCTDFAALCCTDSTIQPAGNCTFELTEWEFRQSLESI